MAELIKKLLEKKKKDSKFKNAGPGHRLNEEKPKATDKASAAQERAPPSSESKQAGAAALARFSAGSSSAPGLPGGFSIATESSSKSAASDTQMAVSGIFFRCPMLGPAILPKEEWKAEIRNYLYASLETERGPTACLIIHTLNKDKEKAAQCISTLRTYIQNLVSEPENEKFHKIRVNNRQFQEKVAHIEGSMDFLKAAGFEVKKLPFNDNEEDFLVLNSEQRDVEHWMMLEDALLNAGPIELELDRNVQVLLPGQATERVHLPVEFYALTPQEIKREQELRIERAQNSMMLRTKAMREKDEMREVRKYNYCIVRVRFPDGYLLQGTFRVYEKLFAVKEMILEGLQTPGQFTLNTGLGKEFTEKEDSCTLRDLKLVPATVLTFVWGESAKPNKFLKEELLETVVEI